MLPTMPLIQKSLQENLTMPQNMDDDADETLSLCDLEIYNDAATSQDYSNMDNDISSSSSSSSSSTSSLEHDMFEFFSEEYWNSNSLTTLLPSNTQQDNIIFCGKIIPSKQPISQNKPKKNRGLFRWNSDRRASYHSNATPITSTPSRSKSTVVPGKYANDFVPKKLSIIQSPTKSRWYLFFFGMGGGFPRKMEMSDIRSRQIRKSPSTMFRLEGSGDKEEVVGGSGRMKLIRALGCGGAESPGSETKVVGKAKVGCFGR